MISPRVQPLHILGLGSSIGTPEEGITAQIIAVKTFEELQSVADQVRCEIIQSLYRGFLCSDWITLLSSFLN